MVRKNMGRVGNLEKEMQEVKTKLEKLAEMEKMVECLTQGLAKVLSALEETSRSVLSIQKSNPVNNSVVQKDSSNAMPREKTLVEDRQAQDHQKIGVSDMPVVMWPFIQIVDSNDRNSTKIKGKQMERMEDEGQRGAPVLEEEIIPLPPYSDYGVKGQLMKVKGRMRHKEVVVLIKTGTTHNFISKKLVQELRLPLTTTRNYRVETMRGNSICRGVTLEMPGLTIAEEYLPLQLLDNVDIILGTKWVRSMDQVTFWHDGGRFTMKIIKGNDVVVWRADPNL